MPVASEPIQAQLPAEGYVREAVVLATVWPGGRSTMWARIRSGEFPAPVKLGPRIVAWDVADLRAWHAVRRSATKA